MAVLVDTGEDRGAEKSEQLYLALCHVCDGQEMVTVLTAVSLLLAGVEQATVDRGGDRAVARKIIVGGLIEALELEAQERGVSLQ